MNFQMCTRRFIASLQQRWNSNRANSSNPARPSCLDVQGTGLSGTCGAVLGQIHSAGAVAKVKPPPLICMSTTVSLVAGTVCWEPADPVSWPEEKPWTLGFRKPTFVNAVIFAQAQVLFLGS